MQNRILQNPWNKCKLLNRYGARWAKGKTGIGLDVHCANSYIPRVQHDAAHAGCRNLHSVHLAL